MDRKARRLLKMAVNELYYTGKVRKSQVKKPLAACKFTIPQLEEHLTKLLDEDICKGTFLKPRIRELKNDI